MATKPTPAEGFTPPPYISSLIAAINEGAKAAQAGALLVMLVGLYLLATAFSASDEDLLLGKAMTISQIGAVLPVTLSFAIAPGVFVFLHVYTLVRYDMLATNLRFFATRLEDEVRRPAEREACYQLLSNVEFVLVLAARQSGQLRSRLWPWLYRGIVAAFPVAMLLLVQINALRYQSELIIWVQRAWLAADLLALVWFFRRNALDSSTWPADMDQSDRRWVRLTWLPLAVLALDCAYLRIPAVDADEKLVRFQQFPFEKQSVARGVGSGGGGGDIDPPPTKFEIYTGYLRKVIAQPLDTTVCPALSWGCRYLRVEHRTLIDKVWDPKAIATFRSGAAISADVAGGVEGVVLRDRSLRFAVLNDSRLFRADLTNADLTGASLSDINLVEAKLDNAILLHADLSNADMREAKLSNSDLSFARLAWARLDGASINEALLQKTDLTSASLKGANLNGARIEDADFSAAQLQGANLRNSRIFTSNLSADMRAADFSFAVLASVTIWSADLRGAVLFDAKVSTRDDQTSLGPLVQVGLTDLRRAEIVSPLRFQADGKMQLLVSADTFAPLAAGKGIPVVVDVAPLEAYRAATTSYYLDVIYPLSPHIANALAYRAALDLGDPNRKDDRNASQQLLCDIRRRAEADHLKLDSFIVDGIARLPKVNGVNCDAAAK